MNKKHSPQCGRFLGKRTVVCCSFAYIAREVKSRAPLEKAVDAFIAVWRFIEGSGLDQDSENELKYALITLGDAAKLPGNLLQGRPVGTDETR